MLYYTYLHRRASDNLPFYVGKGQGTRAWSAKNRNQYWQRTRAKHGVYVEVLAHWPTEAEAFEHEKFLIWCFKDMGYELVNMTDGGEGKSGCKHSPETRQKIASSNVGRKPTPEQIAAASKRMLGNKQFAGRKHSNETKQKISAGNRGKLAGARSPRYGKPIPQSQKDAIAEANSGAKHYGAKKVLCVETGVVYETCTAAAVAMTGNKKSRSAISKAALGKVKRLYGYTWKFV